MTIELGVNFEQAEEDAKIKPFDPADYEFQIEKLEVGESGENSKTPGRPKINWSLKVINAEDSSINGRILFLNTSLPWTNPVTGEMEDSGLSFLTNLCLAVGHKWEGTAFDEQALLGQTGLMKVVIGDYNGEPQNQIKKLYEKAEEAA